MIPLVTDARFTRSHHEDQVRGLLGWTSFVIGGAILVDGVAVRRTRDGALSLSFPEPTDARGKRHVPIRPLDQDARRMIEQQVLRQLGLETTP